MTSNKILRQILHRLVQRWFSKEAGKAQMPVLLSSVIHTHTRSLNKIHVFGRTGESYAYLMHTQSKQVYARQKPEWYLHVSHWHLENPFWNKNINDTVPGILISVFLKRWKNRVYYMKNIELLPVPITVPVTNRMITVVLKC